DGVKINKWIMFLNIIAPVAKKTRFGQILLVGFPGTATLFDQVRKTAGVDKTLIAISINTKGISTHQREVVRQAGMPDRVIFCQQRIFMRESVIGGHERV